MHLRQATAYPWSGNVRLSVGLGAPTELALAVRLPGWCRAPSLSVNDVRLGLDPVVEGGYAILRRRWEDGDVIDIELPMPVERVEAHPRVRQNAGRVALQRGPVLYCLEEIDNGPALADIRLPRDAAVRVEDGPHSIGGVPTLITTGLRRSPAPWRDNLYRRPNADDLSPCDIRAVPYYCWENRGAGEMIVWILEG